MYQGQIVDILPGDVATPQQLGLADGRRAKRGAVPVEAVVAASGR